MKQALAITRKELDNYFGSPMALIFVGIFLVIVLFSFFWVSGFFARGIADVRPLFQWMPLLLIFLISTLTMRQWSEEQQSGTLELLLTMPIKLTQLVIGKFLAVLALVCVALLLTISLPVTVALLGRLDFGPVIGGYLAAVLMAAAYSAIGLFISSRTANQIVALLLTAIVCGLFYLVGTQTITSLAPTSNIGDFLRALGTGSRFESIERGVIDLRDLLYYCTITAIFLALNILSIESKRWSIGARTANYRFNRRLAATLIVINLIVFNILFARVNVARADLTQGGDYTLSPVTQELLGGLQEPLLIRGYFSQETHPLLAPLIPYVRDMLQEYSVASKGKLTLEFVDPITNPQLEQEANQTYGIRPTPLQVNDRGKSSVVNAYVNILIRYGDQNVVLNLLDMIEVQQVGGTPDVHLRNLEYDLTSSIQRVVYGFQNIDAVLASLKQPAQLTLYVTPKTLPDQLKDAPTLITTVANTISKEANGKLIFKTVDMSDPKSGVSAQSLMDQYQIQPIAAGLFSQDTFYLHMVADADGKTQVIFPPTDVSETQIRNDIESAFKRAAPGFLHSVGFWAPQGGQQNPFGQSQTIQQYNTVQQALSKNFDVRTVDLTTGQVPADLSALVLIGPQNLTDIQRYAVDQYLMRGGAVFVAAGNFQMGMGQDGNLAIQPIADGLQAMLAGYGVTVDQSLVLDTQNAPFPVPVQRNVGNVTVNEVQALNYPHFVDVRSNGMDQQSQIIAGLPDITLNWVSPITIDQNKLKDAKITTLLKSTANSWLTKNTNAQPDMTLYPDTGFPVEGDRSPRTLAVLIQGSFTSYFAGKPSPFSTQNVTPTPGPTPAATPTTAVAAASFVQKSPDTARLIVVGSSEFLDDTVFNLEQRLGGDPSVTSVQLVQNSVDWFSEDVALASIRAKGTNTRLLIPLSDPEKSRWEIANYVFALVCLIALGVIWQLRKRSEKPMKLVLSTKKSDRQRLTTAHEGEA